MLPNIVCVCESWLMTLYFLTYSILHDYFMLLFIKVLHENKGILIYDTGLKVLLCMYEFSQSYRIYG